MPFDKSKTFYIIIETSLREVVAPEHGVLKMSSVPSMGRDDSERGFYAQITKTRCE